MEMKDHAPAVVDAVSEREPHSGPLRIILCGKISVFPDLPVDDRPELATSLEIDRTYTIARGIVAHVPHFSFRDATLDSDNFARCAALLRSC